MGGPQIAFKSFMRLTTLTPLFLSLLLGLSLSLPAAAQTQVGESWPLIIDSLQRQGIKKVGDLDLAQFSAEAKSKIRWNYLKKETPSIISGGRTSAVYIYDPSSDTQGVYLNPKLPKEVAPYMPDLELHEALGALGYEDQQYNLSSGLRLLLDAENPEDRKKILKSFSKGLFKEENLRIEGGSSVGGGGDIRALLIKKEVLADIIKEEGQVTLDFLTAYPGINFEPIASNQVNYVALHYEFRNAGSIKAMGPMPRVAITNGYQELISVYVPMHAWEKSAAEKKRIQKEIREKIVGLFPASPKRKAVRLLPICNGTQKMRFPHSNDSDVVYLQYNRGSALKNCFGFEDQTAIIVTTPALPEDAYPLEPGYYHYACTFTLGKLSNRQLIKIAPPSEGGHVQGLSIALDDGDSVHAMTRFNTDGKADWAMISLSKEGQAFGKALRVKKDLTVNDSSISIPYKKQSLSFSCKRR